MKPPITLKTQAAWYALGSVFLYAAATCSMKLLVQYMSPVMLAGFLHLGSSFGLTCGWLLQKPADNKNKGSFLPDRNDWPWLAGAIFFGGIVAALCMMTAMTVTSASCVSLLINLEIVFTVLIAWFFFKEQITLRSAMGLLVILLGSLCLSWHADLSMSGKSILLMSICCLCWAIDTNCIGQMKRSEATQIARCRSLAAGIFNFCLALIIGCHLPGINIIGWAIFTGLIAQGIALVLYIKALQHLGVAKATAYYATEPFIGAVLAVLILREPVGIGLILAACLMGLGVWLHLSEKHEHEHIHTPLD